MLWTSLRGLFLMTSLDFMDMCLVIFCDFRRRVAPKGRMCLMGVRSFSDKIEFYTRNHSHKQSSLLDAIFNYSFYFRAPGTYL